MRRSFLHRWFFANSVLAGLFALAWLLLRSGTRPSRLVYPCQQAAISSATLAFGAPLVAATLALRRRLAHLQSTLGITAAVIGLVATFGVWGYLSRVEASKGPDLPIFQAPLDYRAEVFHVSSCPQQPIGDRFPCFETLVTLMGEHGLKLYRAPTSSHTAGPDGILDSDDLIVIKINYQWAERGGTNTDLLRGTIRSIVEHPEGFTGEIVVCENAQFRSVDGFDRASNNAQDPSLSPHDVVAHFQDLGHDISLFDWTPIRFTAVEEFSTGDLEDGYVVQPWDAQINGAVSYPKFRTDLGTYVSLRNGIWDPSSESYDRERLKFINMPVLKSHSIYGVTANVKDYMGVVTKELGTNSHSAIRYGLLGAHIGEVGMADLNILDAIWINAHPANGPSTSYGDATRRDELLVSTDPVAADRWAAENILIPAFEDNGYSSWPKADPSDPDSDFREYLDNSALAIQATGTDVTNDPSQIDAISVSIPIFSDGFETGSPAGWSSISP